MFSNRHLLRLGAFFCVAFFIIGIVRLFWLRFDAGDLYPPYSSLRSDPLGVQVLYESLNDLEGQGAYRNFRPLSQVVFEPRSTFLLCGIAHNPAAENSHRWEPLLDFVAGDGGRLVFTFTSTVTHESTRSIDEKETVTTNDAVEKSPEETPGLWGLGFELHQRNTSDKPPDGAVRQVPREPGNLPETLTWRSNQFFELNDSNWEIIFSFENEPVVARRSWGKGEVVLVADSYLFSNEALRDHRSSGFLAWVVRADGPVIFDELHHGLSRQPGIAGLVRKYRLHGVVLSLALLVALVIWRQSAIFIPGPADTQSAEQETDPGPDTAEGWVNLMKQHIAANDLLAVCLQAWDSSAATERVSKEQAERVRDIIAQYAETPHRQDPVTVYQSICELLRQGKIP